MRLMAILHPSAILMVSPWRPWFVKGAAVRDLFLKDTKKKTDYNIYIYIQYKYLMSSYFWFFGEVFFDTVCSWKRNERGLIL